MANTAPVPNIRPAMNPAVVVAGGGGDAGGGRGGGKGAGAGREGAAQSKGNGDPDGGDVDGDECGAGGKGGCTNCGSQISKGDPVDVATGEVFTLPAVELDLPGYFNLQLIRSYSSHDRDLNRGLGYGWSHCLDWEMRREGDKLRIVSGSGHNELLPAPEPGSITDAGAWLILPSGDGYVVRAGNEFLHHFLPDPTEADLFRLVRVTFRYRGQLELFYERGQLALVVDTVGRTIEFVRNSVGVIATIEARDPDGARKVFARFSYDGEGNLIETIDANGASTTYQYDIDHRLLDYRYPTGLTFHFRYNRDGQCIETWGDYPGARDPALSEDLPQYLADGQTVARGIHHCRFDYDPEGYTEVTDSVRLQRFFTTPTGLVAKSVDALGNVTERAFDDQGRIAQETDRLGGTAKYEYDANGNLTKETNAEGYTYQLEYDARGRLTRLQDPTGNSYKLFYGPREELEHVEDFRGGSRYFERDDNGLLLWQVFPNGGREEYRYDDQANCIWRKDASGNEFHYRYDYWGNRIEKRAPNGRVSWTTYSNKGQIIGTRDSLAREKRWEYDGMGNCLAVQTQDEQWTRFSYGGYRWLFCTAHPDGTSIERRYNREGWVVEHRNERGERHTLEHDPNGLPVAETTYDGRVNRAGYDAMSRMVWWENQTGRTEFERSPLGLILAKTRHTGAERRYRYNPRGEMVGASNDAVEVDWVRDAGGAIVAEELRVEDARYRVEYGLDANGKCRRLSSSETLGLDYVRDASARVVRIQDQGHTVLEIERSPEGTPSHWSLAQGAALVDELDPIDRVTRRRLIAPGPQERLDGPEWVGKPREIFQEYAWNSVDQLVQSYSADDTTTYEYDARLFLREKKSTNTGTESFRYDTTGNPYESDPSGAATRRYAQGDVLESRNGTTFRYDENHCLIEKRQTKPDGSADVWRFEWDDWRMLSAVETPSGLRVEYLYDAFARRVRKLVHRIDAGGTGAAKSLLGRTDYVWAKSSLLQEIHFDRAGQKTRCRTYVYESDGDYIPIGHRDDEGEWRYYIPDPNGTPEQIIDGAGRVLGRLQRRAYGRTTLLDGSAESTSVRFPGQFEDPETGLHYNRYRYYDPDTGRYLSPDPLGLRGNHNLFAYGPNPIGFYDPMGWEHYAKITKAVGGDGLPLLDHNGQPLHGLPGENGLPKGRIVDASMGLPGDTVDPIPAGLNSMATCHTERKAVHDAGGPRNQGNVDGCDIEMTGEYPPCPNCHRAMQHFASQGTDRKLKYSWKDQDGVTQSISYPSLTASSSKDGKAVPKEQQRAQELLDAYPMNEVNPNATQAVDRFQYKDYPGADQKYRDQSSDIQAQQKQDGRPLRDEFQRDEGLWPGRPGKYRKGNR